MYFEIVRRGKSRSGKKNCVYFHEDRWDDWFKYVTAFSAEYIDTQGVQHELGDVKIGMKGSLFDSNDEKSSRFETIEYLPVCFEEFPLDFFSLGQDSDYYERIKNIGETFRFEYLTKTNDISYDLKLMESVLKLDITLSSLMRSVSVTAIRNQFNRIALGGVKLTEFDFTYNSPNNERVSQYSLEFRVHPQSVPPTNIHVLIGRNGVGKTHLIKNMINSLITVNEKYGSFDLSSGNNTDFANCVCVAFSAFDEFPSSTKDGNIPFLYIGLDQDYNKSDKFDSVRSRIDKLNSQFKTSLQNCFANQTKKRNWKKAISILETDPIFAESNIRNIDIFQNEDLTKSKNAGEVFGKLSSGHKIILLTITQLVEKVEETTLVLLDEPETHLHPPLLAAFVRALSELLIDRNGVAIITTHSPVVLQEVPLDCVWKLRRHGAKMIADRLDCETFGENVGTLTNEVFGLEVTYSGFHKILKELVNKHQGNYTEILEELDNSIGKEGRYILKSMTANYSEEDEIL